jgi:hypothetical protein
MNDHAILQDGEIVPVDLLTWALWFKDDEARRVGWTEINGVEVSTVFLGLNHNFMPGGAPLWFETMIFGGEHDQYQERYSTLEEAMRGHDRAVALVKQSQPD